MNAESDELKMCTINLKTVNKIKKRAGDIKAMMKLKILN